MAIARTTGGGSVKKKPIVTAPTADKKVVVQRQTQRSGRVYRTDQPSSSNTVSGGTKQVVLSRETDAAAQRRAQQRERRAAVRNERRENRQERRTTRRTAGEAPLRDGSGGRQPKRRQVFDRKSGGVSIQSNNQRLPGEGRRTDFADRVSGGGASDGGRLSGSFRDPDLVGSRNDIDDFDGSSFGGGGGAAQGAGGGATGSSLLGAEVLGKVDVRKGKSVEETIYGAKKSRKVRARRS